MMGSSMARRLVAGIILIGLGLALFGSQMPPTPERLPFGLALLAAWAGSGLAVIAGWSWGRWVGLVLSAVGLVLGMVTTSMANAGDARLAADVFFLADGPYFSWEEVWAGTLVFAVLSAIAGALLLFPIRRSAQVDS